MSTLGDMPRALIRWVTTPASMSEQPPTRSVSLGLPRHAKSNPRNHLSGLYQLRF